MFPGDAVLRKVVEADARVYLLDFETGRKLFFWMQEPSDEDDDDYCKQINEYISNPPQTSEGESNAGVQDSGSGGQDDPLRAILQSASRRTQPSTATRQSAANTQVSHSVPSGNQSTANLQNILSQFGGVCVL